MSAFNDSIEQHRGNINNEKTIIATIGRMNPPTSGHAGLIRKMIEYAIDNNLSQINIILSDTVDYEKNPIECEEKRMILYTTIVDYIKRQIIQEINSSESNNDKTSQIQAMKVEIVCMNDDISFPDTNNKILKCVKYLLQLYGYDKDKQQTRNDLNFILFIGEDRKIKHDSTGGFVFIKTMLNQMEPPVVFAEESLPRPEGAISATIVRGWALSNVNEDKQLFENHYKQFGFSENFIEYLYKQIRNMNKEQTDQPAPRKKCKNVDSHDSSGGKKRKTKKYKGKRNKKGTRKTLRYSLVAFSRR